MKILVRTLPKQKYVELVKFRTSVLSLKETLKALSGFLRKHQFKLLDVISAKSRGMDITEISFDTLIRTKDRVEVIAILSNGEQTLEILDYDIHEETEVIHDPEIYITGRDADKLGFEIANAIGKALVSKVIELNQHALEELKQISPNAEQVTKQVLKEAKQLLRTQIKVDLRNVQEN